MSVPSGVSVITSEFVAVIVPPVASVILAATCFGVPAFVAVAAAVSNNARIKIFFINICFNVFWGGTVSRFPGFVCGICDKFVGLARNSTNICNYMAWSRGNDGKSNQLL